MSLFGYSYEQIEKLPLNAQGVYWKTRRDALVAFWCALCVIVVIATIVVLVQIDRHYINSERLACIAKADDAKQAVKCEGVA